MSFLKVSLIGDHAAIEKLKKIPPVARQVALTETTKYLINFGSGNALKWYPPARAQSRYVRTFKLMNSWKSYVEPTRAYITSNVPYAPYPMGDPPTDRMRLRGWRGALERVLANMSKAVAYAKGKVMERINSL